MKRLTEKEKQDYFEIETLDKALRIVKYPYGIMPTDPKIFKVWFEQALKVVKEKNSVESVEKDNFIQIVIDFENQFR